MKYRLLGNSGLRVSEAALGTMTFGEEWGWGSPRDEARKVYDAFREAGGNFINTANFYTKRDERIVSRRVYEGPSPERGAGHEIHHSAPGTDPNAAGNQRKNMMQAVEGEPEAPANRLHRPLLAPHVGPNYASGRNHARAG
jgi:aryl-alcohol dehydrogenase-like predicted oxidoreductase